MKLKCIKGGNNVVAVTETHLIKDKHYDEEIRKSFPGYSLERADSDVKEKKAKKTNSAVKAGPSSEERGEAEDDRLQSGGEDAFYLQAQDSRSFQLIQCVMGYANS